MEPGPRYSTVQQILDEIERSIDRGDRIATLARIEEACQVGVITTRDAERLRAFLAARTGEGMIRHSA
jgi:hypothetical protein